MIIGIEDNSKQNTAFALEALVLIVPDGEAHALLHFAHTPGVARIHLTPAEFMSRIGSAMEQMQGRANLLGLAHGGRPKQ